MPGQTNGHHPSQAPAGAPHVAFLVIGAQKAGTTSLFEYLRRHPGIYMPPEKEIGFFSSDANYGRGWGWYRSIALGGAPAEAMCGEASVGYMGGTPDRRAPGGGYLPPARDARDVPTEDVIPRRVREHLPDARLICVLRDPVARCLSHYRMTVLAGTENRPFEQAICEMLDPGELERARGSVTGNNGYIVRGEYHRILSGYWRSFPARQLMVIFSSELEDEPERTLQRVFEFLGVDTDFVPANMGVRYRQAAIARRVPGLDLYALQQRLSRARSSRALWHSLPGGARPRIGRLYDRASFRVEMWNARRGQLSEEMPGDIRRRLIAHFEPDSQALGSALGVTLPWLDRWQAASAR